MRRQDIRSKPDFIPANAFVGLSVEALTRLCAHTAQLNPRFSYAISKLGPATMVFARVPFGARFDSKKDTFTQALEVGHLSYARLLAIRIYNETQLQKTSIVSALERQRIPVSHNNMLEALLSSSLADEKILRARQWLWKHFGNGTPKNASQLVFEARYFFTYCRPVAALAVCKELLEQHPHSLAQATVMGGNLPIGTQKLELLLEEANGIDQNKKKFSFKDPSASYKRIHLDLFQNTTLLALGSFWVDLIQKSPSVLPRTDMDAMSQSIELMMDKLWKQGACSSPVDSAQRFARNPYLADSPQVLASTKHLNYSALKLQIAPLWEAAAKHPLTPCGHSTLWDAFNDAHQSTGVINPNPFALLPSGQAAALWSLAGDASLIALGIKRGFDPKPIQHLLVEPGASGDMVCIPEQSLKSQWGRHLLDRDYRSSIIVPKLFIDKERGPRARRPVMGSIDKTTEWMRSNLASIALGCGHLAAAQELLKAGCDAPHMSLAVAEIKSVSGREHLSRRVASFEHLSLTETIAEPPLLVHIPSTSRRHSL